MIISIITHVIIALTSIAIASYSFFRPTSSVIKTSYAFIGLTLASGFYLVVEAPAHMIEACSVGVLYLAIVATGTVAARVKLAKLSREVAERE